MTMNKGKRRLVLSLVTLIIALVIAVGGVFAWMTFFETMFVHIQFQSKFIPMTISIQQAIDFDKDGIADLDDEGQYKYGNDLLGARQLIISAMQPTQVYQYKLTVLNRGDADSLMSITWDKYSGAIAEILSVEMFYYSKDNVGQTVKVTSGKSFLCDMMTGDVTGTDNEGVTYNSFVVIDNVPIKLAEPIDVFINITLESSDSMNNHDPNFDVANYNQYANKTFALSKLTLTVYGN